MQKSYLPLLISATVCSTLLAVDVSISGDYADTADTGERATKDASMDWDFTLGSAGPLDEGATISVVMGSLNNDYTDANNRTTYALAYGNGFKGNYGTLAYGASVSHGIYDDVLPDANTFTTKIGLIMPFGGAGASSGASAASARLDVTALTADNFLDAGRTQNGTVGVGISSVIGDLTIGAGIKAGRTTTDNGGSTDLVGADSVDYSEFTAGVKYVSGDWTFNVGAAHTDTSEAVGAESTDSADTTSASISYAVASGVTAILGHTTNETENGIQTTDGSAWYIGANMAF